MTAVVAVLPLASAATQPLDVPATTKLTAWLEAHHLQYGLAGYWDADSATVQAHDKVMIHDIDLRKGGGLALPGYEASKFWYDPSRHDATFVVAQLHGQYPVSAFEGYFGSRPPPTGSETTSSSSTGKTCSPCSSPTPDSGACPHGCGPL